MLIPNRQVTKLTGHRGAVHCVRYSSGLGQYILTGSADRAIRLFNPAKSSLSSPESGLVQTYSAHGYEVLDISVTDDNARFASVGGDKQVFLWDVATARTLRRWAGHFGRVNCVGFGGEEGSVVVSVRFGAVMADRFVESEGSFDTTVRLWDSKSQSTKPIQILEDSKDSVSSLHVLGHEVVTGSVDGKMRLYDVRMGMMYADAIGREMTLRFFTIRRGKLNYLDPITSVQQTNDGNAVLLSTLDSVIRLIDKSNGQMLQSYKGHTNKKYRIRSCLGPGDSVVISGSEDGKIYAWELFTGNVLETLSAHNAKVASAVACNVIRNEFASAGVDGSVIVWGAPQ